LERLSDRSVLPFGIFLKSRSLILSSLVRREAKSHIINLIKGLIFKHVRWLVLKGTGFKCIVEGEDLILRVGFSHFVRSHIPGGITVVVHNGVKVKLVGMDLQQVTLFAQTLKLSKLPDAYKVKGILYRFEKRNPKVGKRR
ncbi:MAG: 50S ribosomal protein L6, partial [Candidatus Hodgkinia cicadicola]